MEGPIVKVKHDYNIRFNQDSPRLLFQFYSHQPPLEVVPIVLKLQHKVISGFIVDKEGERPRLTNVRYEEEQLVQERVKVIEFDGGVSRLKQLTPTEKDQLRARFIDILSNDFRVPDDKHQPFVDEFFREVERGGPVPSLPINVVVTKVTLNMRLDPLHKKVQKEEKDLEEVKIDDLDAKIRQETCSICLEEFDAAKTGAPLARLRCCSHVFHRHCILGWLPTKPSCPLCRCPSRNRKMNNRKVKVTASSSIPVVPRSSRSNSSQSSPFRIWPSTLSGSHSSSSNLFPFTGPVARSSPAIATTSNVVVFDPMDID